MNSFNKYIVAASIFVLAGIAAGCKKSFLEINPKGRLIAEKTSDYDLLLNNFSSFSIDNANVLVPLGDDIAAIEPDFDNSELLTQRAFKWQATLYDQSQNGAGSVAIEFLYTLNKIINEVMESTGGTEAQKKEIRAEALAGRAWAYFYLVNLYGKPYNQATSATDLGFPIVLHADVNQTSFKRATVQEVYDLIVSDLKAAIPDLDINLQHRLRMSKGAAEGLLGKVYVFMHNYPEAVTTLNEAIPHLESSQLAVALYNYNVEFQEGGLFYPIDDIWGPETVLGVQNTQVAYFKQFFNDWSYVNNELVLPPSTTSLFQPSDLRLNFLSTTYFPGDPAFPPGFRRAYGWLSAQIGLTLPDLYLLRAEARARTNDLAGAKADVETLRKNRMPAADAVVPGAIAGNQHSLVKFILDERIREFVMMGYRWFDMRRLSVDPDYSSTVKTSHTLYSEEGDALETYQLLPDRLTLKIPQKILNQNPGMEDNP